MTGRPLRFLLAVVGGWTSIRVFALWPTVTAPLDLISVFVPRAEAAATAPSAPMVSRWLPEVVRRAWSPGRVATVPASGTSPPIVSPVLSPAPSIAQAAPATGLATTEGLAASLGDQQLPLTGSVAAAPAGSRWSASAWAIARPGGGVTSAPFAGQLGGSQAGIRVVYTLDEVRRLAAFGRIAAPLGQRGAEASLGLEWQPTAAPVRLVAEHRFGLDGSRGGPGVAVVGGFGPRALAGGLTAEGYGQAGAIKRNRVEGYIDGALRVAHPVARVGSTVVDLGAGIWGGAQRGAARLDIGPSLGVSVPVAGQRMRLAADWRQRVAGRARPGSGPAVSLGTDF